MSVWISLIRKIVILATRVPSPCLPNEYSSELAQSTLAAAAVEAALIELKVAASATNIERDRSAFLARLE